MGRSEEAWFIAFEGPEGAGKSTQIERLARRLGAAGVQVLCTREPGGTPSGDRIREVILDPDLEVDPLAEFLLYSASRAQLVHEVIKPALAEGRTVITDRFAGASLAYQGYGRGIDRDFIRELTGRVTGGLNPDLTLLLDVDPSVGLERADLDFHGRVRSGFQTIADGDPSWIVLDASKSEDALEERIWSLVRDRHPTLKGASANAAAEPAGGER